MTVSRVRNIPSSELPRDLAAIYERFAGGYGPFRNQVAVFVHVPAALRHLMSMLIELREVATLPKRVLELAIVTVSKLKECAYCVAHHTPFLVVEGVSPAGVERVLDYRDHPEFDDRDKLVVESGIAAWEQPSRIPDALFPRLREYFSEASDGRADPAHYAVRVLQQVQRRARHRGRARSGRAACSN